MRPTKPFHASEAPEAHERLEGSGSVFGLAHAARLAGFMFLSSAKYGWSKRELAAWLANDYAGATLARGAAEVAVYRPSPRPFSPLSLTEDVVTRLVAATRRHVIEALATVGEWRPVRDFVGDGLDRGLVVGVSDGSCFGYAPVNRPRMQLVDRVTSLFVADYLTRPRDYDSLAVCAMCDEVSFEWDEVHEEDCTMRTRRSGIMVKRGRATFAGIGERCDYETGS